MPKNNKKKNRYLHIVDDDLNEIKDFFVNANTPLSAAKKIWRVNKDLDIIWIKDVNTNDIYHFSPSTWTDNKGKKFK
tara:strand:- start:206 stop:436 length:231 start_codon:yes stop_codon:yes gene_type:complete